MKRLINAAIMPWLRRLPTPMRRRLRAGVERVPAVARFVVPGSELDRVPGLVRWGDLRRTQPFSRNWGYDRGTPIDRTYIEAFLLEHALDVQGACLEVLNADYTIRFGGSRVTRADVLDIDPANLAATVVADLDVPDSLPTNRFDCIVFTQTLHLIPRMNVALANVWRALVPGGVLLLTVPALGRHDSRRGFHHDRWRVTQTGLEQLVSELPASRATFSVYGNLLSCVAFLYGLAAEELRPDELQTTDPQFPLIVAARVRKDGSR